jgi:hypothetical protein
MTDQEILSHYRPFEVPPATFDPRSATERQLLEHGLPRRPSAETHPHARAIWEQAFSRPMKGIKAELEVDHAWSNRPRPMLHKAVTKDTPSGWGGVVMEVSQLGFNPPEPAYAVSAEWVVPLVAPVVPPPSQLQVVGFWVGIDGYGNPGPLQAGMAAAAIGNMVGYFAWTEWIPLSAVRVTNLAVNANDLFAVTVCATQSGQGYVAFNNVTTGVATSVTITPAPGVTSQGASVEWIVEATSAELIPFFPFVVFNNISASTKDNSFNLGSGPVIIENITGSKGNLTATAIESATSALVSWQNAT